MARASSVTKGGRHRPTTRLAARLSAFKPGKPSKSGRPGVHRPGSNNAHKSYPRP